MSIDDKLVAAIDNEDERSVERCLKAGADANAELELGISALSYALLLNRTTAIAKLLVLYGADPNVIDFKGWAPLHRCVLRDDPELVRVLLKRGADVGAKEPGGMNASDLAAQYNNQEVAKVLREWQTKKHR